MSGEYKTIFSVNTDEEGMYLTGNMPTKNKDDNDAIRDEVIYEFMGNKQHKEIVKYLKNIGCGKEIIEKEVKFPFKVNFKELSDNLFSWILLISIITFLFNCFKLEYIYICSIIVFCFSLSSMIKRYFRVKKKFTEVKEYLLQYE